MTPDPDKIDELCDFAFALAKAAQTQILPHFRQLTHFENKLVDDFDPVTIADRSAEKIMRQLLQDHYPDHGISGEEFADKPANSDFTWVLDPIDGTRLFIAGMTSWTTLIGLEYKNTPLIGLMHQPYIGETFYGTPHGAYIKKDGQTHRLQVNPATGISQAVMTTTATQYFKSREEKAFLDKMRSATRNILYDGDAYFYSLLAAGHIDIAIDADLQRFDIAPLIPIIEGAGGIVSTWDGKSARNGGNVIAAASRQLYEQALELLP